MSLRELIILHLQQATVTLCTSLTWLGPRYLKTDGRFYSANAMDAYDRRCCINPVRRQTKNDITASLLCCFAVLGMPEYLQMEGKLPMRGSTTGTRIHSAL